MELKLSATNFPTMKHLQLIISRVESDIDAMMLLLGTFVTYQTDALSGIWDANTKTLTIQGFVHSGENC